MIEKVEGKELEFLAFLQQQMEDRKSEDENKVGDNERSTTEYLMLNMVWQAFLRIYYGLYPAIDSNFNGTGRNQKVWGYVEEYRKRSVVGV